MQSRALMLGRRRREANDAARLTLTQAPASCEDASAPPMDKDSLPHAPAESILHAVISQGMGPKKQHEVHIMRDTIVDAIRCSSEPPAQGGDEEVERGYGGRGRSDAITSVINIGEGKGYVSRALAFCDGLQVVGIDCNPAHRERSMERIEALMDATLCLRDGQCGRDVPNLLYAPRGDTRSIVCRVEETADWTALLRSGGVRLSLDSGAAADDHDDGESGDGGTSSAGRGGGDGDSECGVSERRCPLCDAVVGFSLSATPEHPLRARSDGAAEGTMKQTWSEALAEAACSCPLCIPLCNPGEGLAVGLKRPRCPCLAEADDADLTDFVIPGGRFIYLARGTRVQVLCFPSGSNNSDITSRSSSSASVATLTVFGFDYASRCHRVVFDDSSKRTACCVVHCCEPDAVRACHTRVRVLQRTKAVIAVRVETPPPVQRPCVAVPSLSNTMMIGLHTCGDLGSNICRIFARSGSRGLLLVSCCWQDLTARGFPLSEALRARGLSVDQLSLQLATQPLDMWATLSPAGQQGSARLLFFRSMLALLFDRLGAEWEAATAPHCPMAECPHLDPPFLRRVARHKDTMAFRDFALAVVEEFFSVEKSSAYCWSKDSVCAECRVRQRSFLEQRTAPLADALSAEVFDAHFPRFVGLTVLRMWICHLVESVLLLDRALFLYEQCALQPGTGASVALVPLFDGALSPRMYGILVRRFP